MGGLLAPPLGTILAGSTNPWYTRRMLRLELLVDETTNVLEMTTIPSNAATAIREQMGATTHTLTTSIHPHPEGVTTGQTHTTAGVSNGMNICLRRLPHQ